MIENRGNLVQRVVGRPALGASIALALCVPVLGVAMALPMGPTRIVLAVVGAFAVGLALITLGVLLVGHLLGIDRRVAQSEQTAGSAASLDPADDNEEPMGLSIDLREDQPPARPSARPKTQAKAYDKTLAKVRAKTLAKPRSKAADRPEPIILPPPPSGRVHITD